jgi:hypothetical protein
MHARHALIAIALAACGGGGGKKQQVEKPTTEVEAEAAPDPQMMAEIADGLVEVLATMAAIGESAPDCKAKAAQFDDLFEKSAPLFDLAKAQAAEDEAARMLEAEMDAREPQVAPLVARIGKGFERCKMDPDVERAIEKMPTF